MEARGRLAVELINREGEDDPHDEGDNEGVEERMVRMGLMVV